MDGEEGVKNSKAPVARHYRRVHPSDWEPEVHLPRTVSAAKAAANTKETVVGSAKR
jgi:hypothetical protein